VTANEFIYTASKMAPESGLSKPIFLGADPELGALAWQEPCLGWKVVSCVGRLCSLQQKEVINAGSEGKGRGVQLSEK